MNKETKQKTIDKEKKERYLSYKKFMRMKRNYKLCHKTYPAYQSVMEKRKATVYESKLGGIPYIPKGEKWVVCPKCQVEKVLVLQLNISELPDISEKLREWDFIQVFACMKPSETLLKENVKYQENIYEDVIYNDSEYEERVLNQFFYKTKAENRCYNILERNPLYDPLYHELIDGKNMCAGKPFNSYFDIKLIKKDKVAQSFDTPPWIKGYGLYYDEKEKRVVSTIYNDKRTYSWVEGHSNYERVITSWKKVEDVECTYHSDVLNNVCCAEETFEEFDFLGLLGSYAIMDYMEGNIEYNVECPLCENSLTLLFQFQVPQSHLDSDYDKPLMFLNEYNIRFYSYYVYALFYCEQHPELLSCHCIEDEH